MNTEVGYNIISQFSHHSVHLSGLILFPNNDYKYFCIEYYIFKENNKKENVFIIFFHQDKRTII